MEFILDFHKSLGYNIATDGNTTFYFVYNCFRRCKTTAQVIALPSPTDIFKLLC